MGLLQSSQTKWIKNDEERRLGKIRQKKIKKQRKEDGSMIIMEEYYKMKKQEEERQKKKILYMEQETSNLYKIYEKCVEDRSNKYDKLDEYIRQDCLALLISKSHVISKSNDISNILYNEGVNKTIDEIITHEMW